MSTDGETPEPRRAMSRRELLTFGWVRGREQQEEGTPQAAPTGGPVTKGETSFGRGPSIALGTVAEWESTPVGTVRGAPAERPRVYVVRVPEGVLALANRCPSDGGPVAWRPRERSEDDLGGRGRFYCPRDASVFDRRGRAVVGEAEQGMAAVAVTEREGTYWGRLS